MTGETPPAAKGVTEALREAKTLLSDLSLGRSIQNDRFPAQRIDGPLWDKIGDVVRRCETALAALSLPAPGEAERKHGRRENTAFHEWWERSGHAADATFTLTMQNCAHAAWQARALSTPAAGGLAVKARGIADRLHELADSSHSDHDKIRLMLKAAEAHDKRAQDAALSPIGHTTLPTAEGER